jgi:anthranilate phosphoribosyltransferase
MKYNIGDTVTNKNIKSVIKYLFHTDNITHQAIIIHQLNKLINDSDILLSLRNYIFKNSNKIKQYPNSLDTCGTGGDGLKTLNISTTVAILLSSVGIPIAKHGNRAASSLSGSSDIISELKIPNEKNSKKIIKRISNDKFVYLNAPFFYPNLSRVGEVRKKIGIKTIFNYMGPTLNPLGAKFQILGTIDKGSAEIMSKILSKIKNKKFTIFFSEDGLDEISIFAPTNFYFKKEKSITKRKISHMVYKKYLTSKLNFKDIKGGLPSYNANRLIELFQGKKDSYRDITIINSIYAMQTIKPDYQFDNCFEILSNSLDNSIAFNHLNKIKK